MCRICGILHLSKNIDSDETSRIVQSMRDTMSYGGPDSAGHYVKDRIALGHRRLSIIDLSEGGHQPMHFGDYTIVFNGEIYNYEQIKKELISLGHDFKSGSDTEVVIKSILAWGIDGIKKFHGMFAFALWNHKTETLLLSRDRVGVKPLYWYKKDDLILFASELKAFHEHPHFDKTLDFKSVGQYMQQGYIQAPNCIYQHVHKLMPGTCLSISKDREPKQIKYWDAKTAYQENQPSTHTEEELTEELEEKLLESFKLRMVADVPVGMFLSGGIDSSLVSALLQKEFNQSINSFTIGFEEPSRNEAPYAKAVAEHLGTTHHEFICSEEDFKSIIPQLPMIHDEPFGDSSSIPTLLVSRLAREHVKVSLSADGGDELFGGYTKYEISKNIYSKLETLPGSVNKLVGKGIDLLSIDWLNKHSSKLPFLKSYTDVGNKLTKFKQAIKSNSLTEFFNISSVYLDQDVMDSFGVTSHDRYTESGIDYHPDNIISYLGMIDINTYLEGDILTKVDRATMQVSLEGREPMLDHKLIEFAMNIPDKYKIRGKQTKYLLRKILKKHIPSELIERPKQGFSIPLSKWLKGHLKQELIAIQNDKAFYNAFGLNHKYIDSLISTFLNEKKYVNPHIIWFMYGLYKWNNRWN